MSNPAPSLAPPPARIFLVDDHPIVREGLRALIAQYPDLELCGEAGDVPAALDGLAVAQPDLTIIDIVLKDGDGIELIRRLKARMESMRILVWSMHREAHYAERAFRAGALGYVHKGSAPRHIIEAIRSALASRVYVSPEMSEVLVTRLVRGGSSGNDIAGVDLLSDRELLTFRLLGEGLTTRQIAERMHVSPKTVETYRSRVKEKLNVENSSELIRRAVQWLLEQV